MEHLAETMTDFLLRRKYITEVDLTSRACLRSATGVPLFLERM